jgi:hypothetical protein
MVKATSDSTIKRDIIVDAILVAVILLCTAAASFAIAVAVLR